MLSYVVAVQILLGVAGLTQAQSPPNIFPQVNNNLAVQFNGQQVSAGAVLPQGVSGSLPTIGIQPNVNNGGTSGRYLLLVVDLDAANSGNTKNKRADKSAAAPAQTNAAASPAATAVPNAPQQPDDPEHSGGRNTYLHAMIQDYQLTGSSNTFGNGAALLQSGTNGPSQWQPPNPQGQTHRYMLMLFDQPAGFAVPSAVQQMVNNRQNFDLREFMQQANLPLPRFGNYFIVNNGNNNNFGNGGLLASTTTFFTASTGIVTVPGFNGGVSFSTTTSSYFTTSTTTFGNAFQGGLSTSLSTFTTATTFPNGGPTQTFLTVSTAIVAGGAASFGQSLVTYLTTTTFPNGGPTQTFEAVSTAFANNGGFGSSVYLTTTTFPNNGPTQTFLTTSYYQFGAASTTYPSGLLFSTGFTGLRTSTSTGQTTFLTFTTDQNGNPSTFTSASLTTATETFSGVTALSRTTFSTTSTGTTFFNGQLTTYTSSGLTTSTRPAFSTGGAHRAVGGVDHLVEKAVVALCGAALAYL